MTVDFRAGIACPVILFKELKMETTVVDGTEQKQLPEWVTKLIEEAYARGVADGREEMRTAIKSTINCIRLLPAGRAKPKEAA
ncbi:MAG: hypothetical protein KJZ90_02120 [Rhodocyclaceae bacterium]|nr:hypothetical protein [Rhodocyclaceae bacterium]